MLLEAPGSSRGTKKKVNCLVLAVKYVKKLPHRVRHKFQFSPTKLVE